MWLEDPDEMAKSGRTLARFDGQPHPFRLELQGCPTPGCWCQDGTAVAVELTPDPAAARTLRVVVDLSTGAPTGPVEPLTQELASGLPPQVRAAARTRLRDHRARELDGFVLDRSWLGRGGLWPFSHLFRGGTPDEPTYRGLLDRFRAADGRSFTVQDLYCPRAGCDCREVTLSFDRDDGASFTAVVGFERKRPLIGDATGLTRADAEAVFQAWSPSERADRARFVERYRTLREHLARPVAVSPRAHRPAPIPAAQPAVPGPHTPCPCGSGKKYKRCHGAGQPT